MCENVGKDNDLDIVRCVLEPGFLGAKCLRSRPGVQAFLDLVKARNVNAVIAFKLDRLFREASDALIQTLE